MDYWSLRRAAKSIAKQQMGELTAGRLKHVGGDTIEAACDATLPGLSPHDREMLNLLTCRFVVELVFAAEQAATTRH